MSFNSNNKEESYFEDFDSAPIVDEEDNYDDDETFGDVGPLNDEWENQHNLLSEEHEAFLAQNKLREEINGKKDEENEENEDDYSNYSQSRFTNGGGGRDVRHFTQSSTTTTTTTTRTTSTPQFNHLNEDSHLDEDQMESVFKNALDDDHQPYIASPNLQNSNNNLNNKMIELMGGISINESQSTQSSTKGMSLSDIEAKLFEQSSESTTSTTTTSSSTSTITTTSATATTVTTTINNNNTPTKQPQQKSISSPKNNNVQNNRFTRPLSLSDMGNNKPSSPQQHSPRKYKSHQKNSGDKKYMTAEEIQTINRLQAYQIHFTNPFIEDYYYQRFKMKQLGPTHSHTPICDSTPKTAPSPKKIDPLTGALGRIPSHSIRAPRQILQVILNNDEEDQEKNQNSDPTIKLIIESAYNHILDLEDINELIKNTNNDSVLLTEYQIKQEPVSRELFKSLYLDPFPSFKFESPTAPAQEPNQKWPSVCHEDLLFVSLWVFAKGRKLLKRAFPLLNDKQSLSGLFAVCRNLPLLLMLHLPEGSEESTEAIYHIVSKWIMDVPIKFFILGFHFLVNFNQSKFIVKLFQSKEGQSVIHAFLTRGFLIYDQMYLSQNQLTLDPLDREQWRDVFDRFFQRLSGSLSTIFPLNQQPSMLLSQIFQSLLGHCNEQQSQQFHMELGLPQFQKQQQNLSPSQHSSPPPMHPMNPMLQMNPMNPMNPMNMNQMNMNQINQMNPMNMPMNMNQQQFHNHYPQMNR